MPQNQAATGASELERRLARAGEAFARLSAQLKADHPDGQLEQLRMQLASAVAVSAVLGRDLAATPREAVAARTRAGAAFGPDDAGEIARPRAQLGASQPADRPARGASRTGTPALAPAPAPPATR